MSYNVLSAQKFDKELKRLVKKFPSLKKEYLTLIGQLEQFPKAGTDIGKECYKIRLAIASKGKGKRGGARVITYIKVEKKTVFLLFIYDKSEKDNITDKELEDRLKDLP